MLSAKKLAVVGFALFGLLSFGFAICIGTAETAWIRVYPRGMDDHVRSLLQTSDGGYILAVYSRLLSEPYPHAWLVKVDPSGIMEWNKTYREANSDVINVLILTSDGGFAMAGNT